MLRKQMRVAQFADRSGPPTLHQGPNNAFGTRLPAGRAAVPRPCGPHALLQHAPRDLLHEILSSESAFLFGGLPAPGPRSVMVRVGQRGAHLPGARPGHLGTASATTWRALSAFFTRLAIMSFTVTAYVLLMPAIVIRHHRNQSRSRSRFAREFRFLKVGHADTSIPSSG